MNKRLLTGLEISEALIRQVKEDGKYIEERQSEYLVGVQDAKTLREVGKGLEKVIRSSILADDGWVYTIPTSFVEALKKGRMPE